MSDIEKIKASLNLLERLPPSKINRNVLVIASLIPDLANDLIQRVDKPLDIGVDSLNN